MMNRRGKEHSIRQQFVYAETNGTEADGMALQRRLSDLCSHYLERVLGQVLDRCAPASGKLCLQRLDIDLGTFSNAQLENDFLPRLQVALEKAIFESMPASAHDGALQLEDVENVRVIDLQTELWGVLIYFLKTGALPWSFRLPEGNTLEQWILLNWEQARGKQPHFSEMRGDHSTFPEPADQQKEYVGADLPVALRKLLHTSSPARSRLIWQFSRQFRQALLERLLPVEWKEISKILTAFIGSGFQKMERTVWYAFFANIPHDRTIDQAAFIRRVFQTLVEKMAAEKIPLLQQKTVATAFGIHWPALKISQPDQSRKKTSEKTTTDAWTPDKSSKTQNPRPLQDKTAYPNVSVEGIPLHNAGLILLHPFLNLLFKSLGVVEENILTQPERALCLLHFLTTAQPQAPEYELALPKVLCNFPLEAPVDTLIELTAAEMDAANDLLEAVIQHWAALRNTSPDGLRGSFLCRPGLLSHRENGWLLQVERQSQDVLLDRLPWGISVVKLPWMGEMMWVEW